MKELLIATGALLVVFAASSAWATTASGGSVPSTGSSTATSPSPGTSSGISARPRATAWQHLSPVTIATVNPQHSTDALPRPLEKQHRRHPMDMQRHPSLVQASERGTGTDPYTAKTIAQSSDGSSVSAQ